MERSDRTGPRRLVAQSSGCCGLRSLSARHAWALRTPEGFENAVKYFGEATKRDPEFALGYAGLADAFSLYPTRQPLTAGKAYAFALAAIRGDPSTTLRVVLSNVEGREPRGRWPTKSREARTRFPALRRLV